MKILFISEYFPPKIMGGGEINLFLLAKALAKNNEVNVLTSYHKGLNKFEEVDGIKVYRRLKTGDDPKRILSNFKRSFIFPKSIVKEVKRLKNELDFDIIHFIGTSIIAAEELSRIGKNLFATIESYPTLCPKGDRIYKGKHECKIVCSGSKFLKCQVKSSEFGKMKNKFYLKYNPLFLSYVYRYYKKLNNSLKYCNKIAISGYVKNILKQQGLKSEVIPNAIDTSKFYSNQNKEKLKIVYLGSLTKFKGPQILLKAIKDIDCKCDLYGEGVMKDKLNKIIRRNNLDARIHPNVPYNEVPSIYADADIVVFPSIWPEPFGRIAIEAMAAGKPVIASNIGGIKETVENGAGMLVNPGNVDQLKEAIKILASDLKLRKSLGKKGKEKVKNYEENKVIKKLISYYT